MPLSTRTWWFFAPGDAAASLYQFSGSHATPSFRLSTFYYRARWRIPAPFINFLPTHCFPFYARTPPTRAPHPLLPPPHPRSCLTTVLLHTHTLHAFQRFCRTVLVRFSACTVSHTATVCRGTHRTPAAGLPSPMPCRAWCVSTNVSSLNISILKRGNLTAHRKTYILLRLCIRYVPTFCALRTWFATLIIILGPHPPPPASHHHLPPAHAPRAPPHPFRPQA